MADLNSQPKSDLRASNEDEVCFGRCYKSKCCANKCCTVRFKSRFENTICCLMVSVVISLLVGLILPMVLNDLINQEIQAEIVIDGTGAKNYDSWQTNTVRSIEIDILITPALHTFLLRTDQVRT
jgi:hypothetical protein